MSPGVSKYNQIVSFATATLRHKAKWTTKQPCMSSMFWDYVLLPLYLRLNHWHIFKTKPFNWEASEASSWLTISVVILLWRANLQANTGRNCKIHGHQCYQNGCIFDGWEKLKCSFSNTVKFPVVLTPVLMGLPKTWHFQNTSNAWRSV